MKLYQEEKEKMQPFELVNPVSKTILSKKNYVPIHLRAEEVIAQKNEHLHKLRN